MPYYSTLMISISKCLSQVEITLSALFLDEKTALCSPEDAQYLKIILPVILSLSKNRELY